MHKLANLVVKLENSLTYNIILISKPISKYHYPTPNKP